MLLRPGRPAAARHAGGTYAPLGGRVVEPAQFDDLLRLLSPPGTVLANGQCALPRSPGGAQFWSLFGEDVAGPLLLVRALHATAPAIDRVELEPGLTWEVI